MEENLECSNCKTQIGAQSQFVPLCRECYFKKFVQEWFQWINSPEGKKRIAENKAESERFEKELHDEIFKDFRWTRNKDGWRYEKVETNNSAPPRLCGKKEI